jgi:hypothetical protein
LESDKALARKVKRDGNELFGIVYATAAAIGFNFGDRMICGAASGWITIDFLPGVELMRLAEPVPDGSIHRARLAALAAML